MTAKLNSVLRIAFVSAALAGTAAQTAGAQTVFWTNWMNATLGSGGTVAGQPGTATGVINAPGGDINVLYTGEVNTATQIGPITTDYWTPAGTYTSVADPNAPLTDNISLDGIATLTYTITFSSPVQNLFFDIVSLGQGRDPVSYNFDQPFTILSQGPGNPFGGCATCLSQPSPNTITGTEGDGTLEFSGVFTELSWTVTNSEDWHGFQIGTDDVAAVTSTPEPSTIALLATGLVGLVPVVRRRKNG